jgi:glycosyltransferase involved in cell wall biosynthesis
MRFATIISRDVPVTSRISIYHNILWSKYKGVVFTAVHSCSSRLGIDVSFIQVAETEAQRIAIGKIDLSYHRYPYRLLFAGSYESVPIWRRIMALSNDLIRNPCELVVLPGYEHIEYWAMMIVCMVLRRKRAVFCDSTVYDRPKYRWKEIAKGVFFRRCHGFFCYGKRSKEYVLSYGVEPKRIKYRCQAAALPHTYDAAKVVSEYRANANGFDGSTHPTFLYVGRLSVEKGIDDLLEAFNQVLAKLPESKLHLVGAGPLEEILTARVKNLGVEQSVKFLGPKNVDEIARLFVSSTALVLPSHSEPWGLVVNESLSYGCPVVVSHVCGCVPELVLPGVTGYSYPVRNVSALAEAMLDVSRMSTDRAAVAQRCINLISRFSPDVAASQILDGCARILDGT